MKVILKPILGTPKANLERAKVEIERVLSFRGNIVNTHASGAKILVKVEINPKWDLPLSEKVDYLKEWITAKVKTVFEVISVSATEH
jgi:DNA-binding protein YbaB